ncbi:MAG: hypothetical protein IMZ52_02780 [Actinobacteria bacterium]|nr:hypothetical protein [Actinomycetota bacterium]
MKKVKIGDYVIDLITDNGKGDIGKVNKIEEGRKIWIFWLNGFEKGLNTYFWDGIEPPYFKIISKDEAFVRMI